MNSKGESSEIGVQKLQKALQQSGLPPQSDRRLRLLCSVDTVPALDAAWPALGLNPATVIIAQPPIEAMQPARPPGTIGIQNEQTVAAGSGITLVVRGP